jgi:hypothetical protein
VQRYRVGLLTAIGATASILAGELHDWPIRALFLVISALAAGSAAQP